jgi:uncharacterized protein (DUF2141 family)
MAGDGHHRTTTMVPARLITVMLLIAAPFPGSVQARAAIVHIAVTGVTQARGHVRVELCTRETFLTNDCPYQGQAPAVVGSTLVTVSDVPPGQYAVQAFHDVTDHGVVHQNLLGIPKESIGFSNDAPLRLRGPRFSDAAFFVGREAQSITLKLRRLFRGPL